jgi:hypothetical protein
MQTRLHHGFPGCSHREMAVTVRVPRILWALKSGMWIKPFYLAGDLRAQSAWVKRRDAGNSAAALKDSGPK